VVAACKQKPGELLSGSTPVSEDLTRQSASGHLRSAAMRPFLPMQLDHLRSESGHS